MRTFLTLLMPVFVLASVNWAGLLDQSGGSKVYFGVQLDGPQPFERNSAENFAPASTAKLATAAMALDVLGPDFRYETVLRWKRVDESSVTAMELVGSGDPSWGMSEFGETRTSRLTALALELKKRGIKKIYGRPQALASDPRWDRIVFPLGWKATDPLGCGGTLAQSFNNDLNCGVMAVTSATTSRWITTGGDTPVRLELSEGKTTSLSIGLEPLGEGTWGYVVKGSWKKGSAASSFTLPIWNARSWTQNLFAEILKKEGIEIVPVTYLGRSPGEAEQFSTFSRPLSELLKPFLKNSVNMLGDAFLKKAGETDPLGNDLLSAGLAVMQDYLVSARVPAEYQMNDGSGLSRSAQFSPRAMLALLHHVKAQSYFPALWGALPIAAIDGTLRNRMKGTAAAKVLRAKTGTLDGVYNLAGFVPDGNDYVPFVVLTRTTTSLSGTARSAADRVGARLSSLVKASVQTDEEIVPFPYVPEHAGFDDQ